MNEGLKPIPETAQQATGLPLLSVVVTFNERDNVTELYRKLEAKLEGLAWEVTIITAIIPNRWQGHVETIHGIGWTPDQTKVWQASTAGDPHVYIWDMLDPMSPVLKDRLTLRSGAGRTG
jgi:hypothetical protein